jgi:TolB-like protein/Tfp pilus assembly protein PilF
MSRLKRLIVEIHRRSLWQVLLVYVGGAWVCYEIIDTITDRLVLPQWIPVLAIILFLIGLPFVVATACVRERGSAAQESPVAEPSSATEESVVMVEEAAFHPEPRDAGRKSVAVLPFVNLSAEPESEYFSDGITFDIINHLAKITDLKVISRTSVMRYKATEVPLRQIGKELGVATIVEGEVQRVGDRVRISAQLVDARTDEHLWADQYDRELLDVFAIQSDVAQQVAGALKTTLTSGQKRRIERRPTGDFEAYNLYLKGRYFWDRRGEGITKGLEYFQRALEIDPDYALAHAGVADCILLLGFYGYLPPREAWPKAKAAALRALDIDEGLAEAHSSLAFAKVCYDWDMQAAEKDFKRAIELNPGYAPAHYWYATLFLAVGRFEDGFSQNERSLEVDPLSIFATAHYGWCLIGGRQYGRAREQLKRALELDPNFAHAHWLLGWVDGMESKFEDGIARLQRALELSGDFPWFLAHLGWVYGVSGRADEAREVLSELNARRREQYVRSVYFALVHTGLGEPDEALDWLEKAYEERDIWMAWLANDATFDSLRSDPRFNALIKKVGVA